jgi:predicted RND superfamily exporter protein
VARHGKRDFALAVAGVPYTVAMMQRQLSRDFTVFSAVAVAGFGLATLLLFGSIRVTVAVVASCTAAVAITFLVLHASGASLGLLSANLVTIVFVLTQSHLVFLTSNWRRSASEESGEGPVARAMRETLRPSIASTATTLLGFGTLLFVDAKPLRELGLGGVVGGGAAFAVSYLLYPLFLVGARPKQVLRDRSARLVAALTQRRPAFAVVLAAACLLAGVGLTRLDTDPSMLSYFDEDGEIHEALAYLDRNTGSTPLELVLRRADGQEILEADDAYRELWQVQHALEADPTVGRIVSLPVLLAEGERFPLSFLMTNSMWLRLLDSPLFDRVGKSFVSDDRMHTLFALHMAEERRDTTRIEVLERLQGIVARAGFEAPLTGGVFFLQGTLSELVARSMVQSLVVLAVLFAVIAWWTTGSIRVALCMVFVLALIPVAVFGAMGLLGAPIDIVTAPAASIGLGLAADTLLHLGDAARRSASTPRGAAWSEWHAWTGGIRSQWKGIACAALIVAAGFSLFGFSGFPPTRRFGLAGAASTAVAAPLALVVLPLLASRAFGSRPRR